MFSNNVNIRTNDGHSIFDLNTKQKISREKSINIGNHVWIGLNSTILHCDIEDGCIIGANSIVNRSYKPNCIIAGNPAKVIRENILWDKRNDIMFEDL